MSDKMIDIFWQGCCIKCGVDKSWCESKEHRNTKLANHCKVGNTDKHIWGNARINYEMKDIIPK